MTDFILSSFLTSFSWCTFPWDLPNVEYVILYDMENSNFKKSLRRKNWRIIHQSALPLVWNSQGACILWIHFQTLEFLLSLDDCIFLQWQPGSLSVLLRLILLNSVQRGEYNSLMFHPI